MNEFVLLREEIDKKAVKKLKKILNLYKKSQNKVVKELSAAIIDRLAEDGTIRLDRDKLKKLLKDEVGQLADQSNQQLTMILAESYEEMIKESYKLIGIEVDYKLTRKEFIDAAVKAPIAGKTFSKRIWKNCNDLANTIYADVNKIVKTGASPEKVARQVKKQYNSSAYQAKRLVNTELAKVVNQATLDVYSNSGVVQKVMWTATLEKNTCSICGDRDGKEFSLKEVPFLPAHPNCRCCLIPIVDGYKPDKRVINNKTANDTIDYKSFNEWNS